MEWFVMGTSLLYETKEFVQRQAEKRCIFVLKWRQTVQYSGDKFNSQEICLVIFAFEEVGLRDFGGVGDVSASGVALALHGIVVVVQARNKVW
jgi:hypothetical protein